MSVRYFAAKAESALALYRRMREGDSPFARVALRVALDHFLRGRLTFVYSETKGDSMPPSGEAPGKLLPVPASASVYREFPRRFLVRRLVDPGPKSVFVGDLVLLRLGLEASPLEELDRARAPALLRATPLPGSLPASHGPAPGTPGLRETAPLAPGSTGGPSFLGLGASGSSRVSTGVSALDSHPGAPGFPPCTAQNSDASSPNGGPNGGPCLPGDQTPGGAVPSPPAPAPCAEVLRRVAALEGAEMVSDDPQDQAFVIPRGHCWLLQEPPEHHGGQQQGQQGSPEEEELQIDEWDSRRTGPVPCSQIVGRAIYVCHSPIHHEQIINSAEAMRRDAPVLAAELDVETLGHG